MAKSKKRGHFFLVLIISYMVIMLYRIVLTYIIGGKGLTYFSVPNEVFILLGGGLSFGLTESIGILVENRIERGQYYNSGIIFRSGMVISMVVGVLVSAVLFFLGKGVVAFFNMPLSYMAYMTMVPAIFLMVVAGALRGFCRGNGYRLVVSQSYFVFMLSYIVFGVLFALLFQKQGNKVAALLRIEDYKYSYGALGASVGLLVASAVCLIHMLFTYFMMKQRNRYEESRDYNRSFESPSTGLKLVLKNSLIPCALWLALYSFTVIDEIIIFSDKDLLVSMDFTFGEYYGKSYPIPVIFGLMIIISCYGAMRKAISLVFREEYRNAREKLKGIVHRLSTYGFFLIAMMVVLSNNILSSLFANNGQDASGLMALQAVMVFTGLFAIVLLKLITGVGYNNLAATICGIGVVAHVLLALLFSKSFKMSISGAIIADIILFAVITVGGYFVTARVFQYTQEWFRTFAVSFISAAGCGIIGFLINMVLSPLIGKFAAIVLVFVISLLLYMVILLLLRGYEEEELEGTRLGKVMLAIGNILHL